LATAYYITKNFKERRIDIMKKFFMDLSDLEEMETLESPTCIIGRWFFVHK